MAIPTTNTYIASYFIDEKERVIHYLSVLEEYDSIVSYSIGTTELTPIMLEQVLEVLPEGHNGQPETSLEMFNNIAQNYEQEVRVSLISC
tara:strand:+ start:1928 stop:2197 length:270 start_codon:yes stop_codon:yes gene_type:complete